MCPSVAAHFIVFSQRQNARTERHHAQYDHHFNRQGVLRRSVPSHTTLSRIDLKDAYCSSTFVPAAIATSSVLRSQTERSVSTDDPNTIFHLFFLMISRIQFRPVSVRRVSCKTHTWQPSSKIASYLQEKTFIFMIQNFQLTGCRQSWLDPLLTLSWSTASKRVPSYITAKSDWINGVSVWSAAFLMMRTLSRSFDAYWRILMIVSLCVALRFPLPSSFVEW